MEPVSVCPECGERAVPRPPRTLVDYAAHGLAVPEWSHADGEPLCPVAGPGGYQPAEAVAVARFGPELAGTWLDGPAARNADELHADTAAFAVAHGMPTTPEDRHALGAWAALPATPWGSRHADTELSDYLAEFAEDAVTYLDTVTDGASWLLDDGLQLLPDGHDHTGTRHDDEHADHGQRTELASAA